MYEIAKARVSFKSWAIVLSGIDIEEIYEKDTFNFDGVVYPSVDDAIAQYSQNFDLPSGYLKATLNSLGITEFARAVRFCRIMVGSTPAGVKRVSIY